SRAYHAESVFVALESFIKRTPSTSPQGSNRCSTASKLARPSATASGEAPALRAASDAAIALHRLCLPLRATLSSCTSSTLPSNSICKESPFIIADEVLPPLALQHNWQSSPLDRPR